MTVAELLASISAMGVLVSIGALSLAPLTAAFGLDNGSRTVAMALSQARVFAITRAHVVQVSFTSHGFTMRDTEVDADGQILMAGEMPNEVAIEASGTASFSALGTVAAPLTVTLDRAGDTRVVRVALTGEVSIE